MTNFANVELIIAFLLSPFVSYTFDLFKSEGMIFESYHNWLKKYEKNPLTKPLGLCSNCMNIWITALMLVLVTYAPLTAFLIFGFSISNYLLKLIYK